MDLANVNLLDQSPPPPPHEVRTNASVYYKINYSNYGDTLEKYSGSSKILINLLS